MNASCPRRGIDLVHQLTTGERQNALVILLCVFVVGLAMAAAGGSDPLGVHGVIVLHVGDEVSVYADPISTARTSMTFRAEACAAPGTVTSRSR